MAYCGWESPDSIDTYVTKQAAENGVDDLLQQYQITESDFEPFYGAIRDRRCVYYPLEEMEFMDKFIDRIIPGATYENSLQDIKIFLELSARKAWSVILRKYFTEDGYRNEVQDPQVPTIQAVQPKQHKFISGFKLFYNEKRTSIKKAHPDWKNTQVMKEVNKLYKELSAQDKEVYNRKRCTPKSEMKERVSQLEYKLMIAEELLGKNFWE